MAPRNNSLPEPSVYALDGPSGTSSDRIVHFFKQVSGKRTWFFFHEGEGWAVWAQKDPGSNSGMKAVPWRFDEAKYHEEHLESARIARRLEYNTYERAKELMVHFASQPKYKSFKEAPSKDKMAKGNNILTSPDSILVGADLIKLLANPATWAHFDEDDKARIRKLIPAHVPVDSEGLPTKEWLKYSPDWQQAVRLFQVDLKAGRMEPEWLAQAAQAMEERAEGKFDDWKEKNFEEYWGQKAKPPVTKPAKVGGRSAKPGGNNAKPGGSNTKQGGSSAKTGAAEGGKGSTSLRFPQMVRDGVFEVGDVLSYSRLYVQDKGASNVLLEKRVKIVAVDTDKGFFTCAIPPGTSTLPDPESASSPTLPDNCITYETNSNIALATKIIDVDGRIDSGSLGRIRTAWEDIQCHRGGNHMGSLFDLRELHYLSLNS